MVKNQTVIGENAAMCALDSVLSSILGNLLNASWAKWWHTTRVLLCIWSTVQLTESSWVKIPIWISSLCSLGKLFLKSPTFELIFFAFPWAKGIRLFVHWLKHKKVRKFSTVVFCFRLKLNFRIEIKKISTFKSPLCTAVWLGVSKKFQFRGKNLDLKVSVKVKPKDIE